jgi:hypothetical protein
MAIILNLEARDIESTSYSRCLSRLRRAPMVIASTEQNCERFTERPATSELVA